MPDMSLTICHPYATLLGHSQAYQEVAAHRITADIDNLVSLAPADLQLSVRWPWRYLRFLLASVVCQPGPIIKMMSRPSCMTGRIRYV